MKWKASLTQTLNIMREEVGQVLSSWGFFFLTIVTVGFFTFQVFSNFNYPQRLTTDFGLIKALIGSYGGSEVVAFISRYCVLQLGELLSRQLLFLTFSISFGPGIFVIILVALQTCDNISGDRAQGTLLLYFSKPIRRSKLILARFFSFAVLSFVLVFVLHVIPLLLFVFYILIPSGVLFPSFFDLFRLILGGTFVLTAFILAVGSITYFFSSLIDNSLLACLASLIVTIIPSYVMTYTSSLNWSRIDLEGSLFSIYTHVINSENSLLNLPPPWVATIILLSLVVIPLGVACIITERKEFR